MVWYTFPKINDCRNCGGTGIKQWFYLDGETIYHWMKPKTKECEVCKGKDEEELYVLEQS